MKRTAEKRTEEQEAEENRRQSCTSYNPQSDKAAIISTTGPLTQF
jgi:hypothetical protein